MSQGAQDARGKHGIDQTLQPGVDVVCRVLRKWAADLGRRAVHHTDTLQRIGDVVVHGR